MRKMRFRRGVEIRKVTTPSFLFPITLFFRPKFGLFRRQTMQELRIALTIGAVPVSFFFFVLFLFCSFSFLSPYGYAPACFGVPRPLFFLFFLCPLPSDQ